MNPLKAVNPIIVTKGAIGLAGTAAGLAGTVAREAVHAPVGMTKGAIHLAGAAAGLAGTVARDTVHGLRTDQGEEHEEAPRVGGSAVSDDVSNSAGPTTAATAVTDVAGAPAGPTIVPVEPHAPEEPPVDVVGAALAAEAAAERGEGVDGAGLAHEPRAASRDEEHGGALQRAEVEEIAEEAAAALEGDVEPEQHLTEQLLDPADAKAVAAELAMTSKAADTDKS